MPKKTISRKMNKKNISKKMRRKRTKQRKVQKKSRKKGGYRGRRKSMKGGAEGGAAATDAAKEAERDRVLLIELSKMTGIPFKYLVTEESVAKSGVMVGKTSISDLITYYIEKMQKVEEKKTEVISSDGSAPQAKKRRTTPSLKDLADDLLKKILNSFNLFDRRITREKLSEILGIVVRSDECGEKLKATAQILIDGFENGQSMQEMSTLLKKEDIIGKDTQSEFDGILRDIFLKGELYDALAVDVYDALLAVNVYNALLAVDVIDFLKANKVTDLELTKDSVKGQVKTTYAKVHFYYGLAREVYQKVFGDPDTVKVYAKNFIRMKQKEAMDSLTITASPSGPLIKTLALQLVNKIMVDRGIEDKIIKELIEKLPLEAEALNP